MPTTNDAASGGSGKAASTASSVKYPSKYEITKDYGGMKNFMLSYGLKLHEPDDVEEANAIIEGLQKVEYQRRVDAASKAS